MHFVLSATLKNYNIKHYDTMYTFLLPRSQQSRENKRHVKSVKIGASLFLITIITYTPIELAYVIGIPFFRYIEHAIYINNFINFFVYLWIDEDFRRWILRKP